MSIFSLRAFALRTCRHQRRFSSSKLPNGASWLNMPALSPTMTSGTISKWNLSEAQAFSPGDVICEVETDKATVDFEAVDDGILAKIVVPGGSSDVEVGSPIAIVTESEEALELVKSQSFELPSPIASPSDTKVIEQPAPESVPVETSSKRSSPAAAILAKNLGVDFGVIDGSGKHGIITKGDVLVAAGVIEPTISSVNETSKIEKVEKTQVERDIEETGFEDLRLSSMRRVIATRMVESKAKATHNYISIKCRVDEPNLLRQKVKTTFAKTFSLNDLVILACARSLQDNPALLPKQTTQEIDVSVAVATETGLITPIVKNAAIKGLLQINEEVKELAGRARIGKLLPDEYTGGSFTVSNLGMFGINSFTAVINQPQRAILAVGTLKKTFGKVNDEVKAVTEMEVTLSYDRKHVVEQDAAQFLQSFRRYISEPMNFLV